MKIILRLCLQWGILGLQLWAYFNAFFQNILSCVCWRFCPQHWEDSLPHLSCLLKAVGRWKQFRVTEWKAVMDHVKRWDTLWRLVFNVRTITLVDINAAWRMSKLQWTEMACWDKSIFLVFQVHNVSKLDIAQYILGLKTA